MQNMFLFKITKETHEQRKTKIACMNSEAGQLKSALIFLGSLYQWICCPTFLGAGALYAPLQVVACSSRFHLVPRFLLFVKAFLAVTSHLCAYHHFFVLLCPAILGFSFLALRKKALFLKRLFLD
jgi:hypothetical protein